MKKSKGKASLGNIIESMYDDILAKDIETCNGIGTDNMSCIVIEIKKWK